MSENKYETTNDYDLPAYCAWCGASVGSVAITDTEGSLFNTTHCLDAYRLHNENKRLRELAQTTLGALEGHVWEQMSRAANLKWGDFFSDHEAAQIEELRTILNAPVAAAPYALAAPATDENGAQS